MDCCCVVVFFLFKQKTAYEMRISDWSSDVCSSDLLDTALQGNGFGVLVDDGIADIGAAAIRVDLRLGVDSAIIGAATGLVGHAIERVGIGALLVALAGSEEIGRAHV